MYFGRQIRQNPKHKQRGGPYRHGHKYKTHQKGRQQGHANNARDGGWFAVYLFFQKYNPRKTGFAKQRIQKGIKNGANDSQKETEIQFYTHGV